jgi:hypothetical protein
MDKPLMTRLLSLVSLCVAAVGLLFGHVALADSWAMPETKTVLSAGGQFRFTVTPSEIGSQLDYFREEVAAEKTGEPVERPAPLGLLERRGADGKWAPVWAGPLVNPVAPVTVLVADDGRHVVTFDNWHSVGHGEHVIVIYGPDGALVRSLSLTDLVSEDYMMALPRSVSSIYWSKEEGFSADGASIIIPVIVPHGGGLGDEVETVPFTIALADGAVTLPDVGVWEHAQQAAAGVIAAQRQAELDRIAYLTKPLTAPEGCEMRDWHEYLREAYARLSPEPAFQGSTSTTVLFPRDHSRQRESQKWLRDEVADMQDFPSNAAFASPCDPDGLVEAFATAVKKVKPGAAAEATFFIAAPEPQFAAIAQMIAPTGAKSVWLDPAAAIEQRPDRIPGSAEQKAAQEEEMEQIDAELGID